MSGNKHLIVITGPTAVGKTSIAIQLAKTLKTEIISADSRQIYKELHIGTAAPSIEEMEGIPHHFIKSISVNDYYNASMFEVDVLEKLEVLFQKYTVVIMVGGSTLYVDGVCFGIDDLPPVDLALRTRLKLQYKEEGIDFLRRELEILDPEHFEKVDINNPNRMMKAIEICMMTGKTYSSLLTATRKTRDFNIMRIGINCDREVLYNRINQRVDVMLQQGLKDEVKSLEYARNSNALQTVGYRELFDYLDGNVTLDEAITKIKTNTRRYAKRQLTWFMRDKSMTWFHPEETTLLTNFIQSGI